MTMSQLNSQTRRAALSAALLAASLAAATSASAADVVKLATGANLTDATGWDGGVLPGSGNVGLFNSTTVPTSGGATFTSSGSSSLQTFAGLKVTDAAGPLTINNSGNPLTIGTSGIDMSAAAADLSVTGTLRFAGGASLNVASGRTLSLQSTSTNANSTITLLGGGTLAVNGTFTGGNRLSLLVTNGTIAGTGTYRGNNTNTGYAVRVQTGSFVAPGNVGVGTLTFDSSGTSQTLLDMQSGSGFKFDLGAASGSGFSAPGSSDRLAITNAAAGDVAFNNNTVSFGGGGEVGVYKLFDTSLDASTWTGLSFSGQIITGGLTVSDLAAGLTGTLYLGDGSTFGDTGDIYLQVSAVPEPSAFAALAGVAGLGCAALRRRRRA